MPSNRRKQFNPTKSVNIIESDDKAGTSSGNHGDNEVDYREVVLKMGRGVGYFIKNFIYIKNRECHGKIFLRCQHRTSCSARAFIQQSNNKAIVTQVYHPHPPPNNKTLEFKTPLSAEKKRRQSPTKKRNTPSRVSPRKAPSSKGSPSKASSRKISPRKALVLKSEEESQGEEEAETTKIKEETQSSQSDDELEKKPSPQLLREKSQRTRKLPARLREDPSPIPPTKKRRKKRVLIVAPQKKKKVINLVPKHEPQQPLVIFGDDDEQSDNSDSASDSEPEETDDKDEEDFSDASPSRSSSRSPSRSPRGTNRQRSPGSPGSTPTKDSTAELLRHLTNAAGTLDSEPEDDDLVVSSDDDNDDKRSVKPKVVEKKEPKQRMILDVDQLRKLSATALVLKFSRHTTSKVPKDLETFTYQHQYACTMLPGICSEKFCGNAVDTKPQIKRHLLRHIGELLTMTNQSKSQISPATAFPGSVQSQAKRGMPTTEEIEEFEEADSRPSSPIIEEAGPSQTADNPPMSPELQPAQEDSNTPCKVETKSYMIPSSHQPNKAVTVELPKDVNVRRSSFTVIRSAEGVNEVMLLPKGRLINLSTMQGIEKDEEDDEDNKYRNEKPEDALERAKLEEKNKRRPFYPNYKRKKGLSKTRAFQLRQSAVRLEIVDDFDEDIDIEDTGDEEEDNVNPVDEDKDEEEKHSGESAEEKIETEEVSLSGAFQSPETESPPSSSIIPSTSQDIECDIIVRTRRHNASKKPTLPRSVGQSLKSVNQLIIAADSKHVNRIAMDPPGDDHNYAWHPTRYIAGPTHTDSKGNAVDIPEETDDNEEKFDLDPIFYPLQSPSGDVKPKKLKKRKPIVKSIRGVGKVVSHPKSQSAAASNPRWVKVPSRDKREPTDEEKKMKKKALELLNALHKKQPLKGRKGPFKCQLCGKNVTAAGTLRAHYRSHAGIKPYRCKLCGATFTRLHSLKYHMMIHNQQCRFVCDHCSREFRHASHFREHLRRHTGEEPFGCTDCTARFKTRNTYKRHLFAKHGKLLTADGIQLIPIAP